MKEIIRPGIFIALTIGVVIVNIAATFATNSESDIHELWLKISCENYNYGKKIAKKLFEKGKYQLCLDELISVKEQEKASTALSFNIGLCNYLLGKRKEAISNFLKCFSTNHKIDFYSTYFVAVSYHELGEFETAIHHYNRSLQLSYVESKSIMENKIKKNIKSCKNGIELNKAINQTFKLAAIHEINSEKSEFNPVKVDSSLYFSIVDSYENRFSFLPSKSIREKIYRTTIFSDKWCKPVELSSNLLDEKDLALVSKFKDSFIVYDGRVANGNLHIAELRDSLLVVKEKLNEISEIGSSETAICFNSQYNEVYFISNRKEGKGFGDIYYSKMQANKSWSKPVNLVHLNSPYDEREIALSHNDNILYICSNRESSIGGYDLFQCKRLKNGLWSSPKNVGIEVNSGANDISVHATKEGFLFASDRPGGKGSFDLYEVKYLNESSGKSGYYQNTPKGKICFISSHNNSKQVLKFPVTKVYYKIQVAACKREMSDKELQDIYKGNLKIHSFYSSHHNWHKYTIGEFSSLEEAIRTRKDCGVSDSFILMIRETDINPIYQSEEKYYQ
jgi:tetratricopeptide (TPR) repeat protein